MRHLILAAFAALTAIVPKSAHAEIVVELFQSQGCSSCPPAIANMNALVDRPDVLPLMFAVTYWDRLGWKDTFAQPEYTSRQYDYAASLHHNNVYTPQIVINGGKDLVGANRIELDREISRSAPPRSAEIAVENGAVIISGPSADTTADVWLVRYDPRRLDVAIGAGENGGAVIAHRNIVRELTHLGVWLGPPARFEVPPAQDAAWRTAILVQKLHGGVILGAKALKEG